MARKSRLKEDAFSWVQDTAQPEEKPQPPAKAKPRAAKKPRTIASFAQGRSLLVRYQTSDGQIIAILEKREGNTAEIGWSEIPASHEVSQFALTGDLMTMALVDIHSNYRVDTSGATPKLVRV